MSTISIKDIIKDIDTGFLAKILVVANVGYFVYKHFKENPSIISLSQNHSSKNLIIALEEILSKNEIDFTDRIIIYSLVTALCLKSDIVSSEFIKGFDGSKIRWWSDFKELYLLNLKTTTTYIVNLNYQNVLNYTTNSVKFIPKVIKKVEKV